jgi:ABC-2 type transport system permease protein
MKILDIALKDMRRSFRNAFALVFMFGVPLLMTGMFYLMFGGQSKASSSFSVPVTKVVIADLDQGSPSFTAANIPTGDAVPPASMGEVIVSTLQQKNFADLIQVGLADSAAAARSAVDSQQAGVALIIPADFTAQFSDLNGQASLELYKDPTLTLGPAIVQSVMDQFMDNMSGAKIAVRVTVNQVGGGDSALVGQVVQQYLSGVSTADPTAELLDVRATTTTKPANNALMTIIAPIMGWLIVFYAFFTGASTAQSILREDEEGTLPRLFTTPTTQATVLGGKFLAVGLTVVVQMLVLLVLGRLIFGIAWGALAPLALLTAGTILVAASFGIFINSLLKNTKQSGLVFGGLLTVLGMLGGIPVFAAGSASADTFAKVSLLVPQGWAVQGLLQAMKGATGAEMLPTFLVLVAWSVVFFVIGVQRFQKRYA